MRVAQCGSVNGVQTSGQIHNLPSTWPIRMASKHDSMYVIARCHAQIFVGMVTYIGAYHLLSAYYLSTYYYKHMHLLTRFYSISLTPIGAVHIDIKMYGIYMDFWAS